MAESHEVSRRRFLKGAVAAAAAPPLLALAQAEAATTKKKKAAAKPAAAVAPKAGPDYSVAKTPEERAALEKQYKQLVDILETVRKVPVQTGGEFATGALAPLRLRRGEA